MGELVYTHLEARWAKQLEGVERRAFPTVDPEHLYDEHSLRSLAHDWPEGSFAVLDGDTPVAMGCGVRVHFDIDHPQHTWEDLFPDPTVSGDDPTGEWYYGTTITVDPAYRRHGIGRRLYELRKQVCRDHGLRGIIAGGVIPGYAAHRHEMTAADYVAKVVAGELYDRTLTFQLENGFEVRGMLEHYLPDPEVDGWATFIVWLNPDHPSSPPSPPDAPGAPT